MAKRLLNLHILGNPRAPFREVDVNSFGAYFACVVHHIRFVGLEQYINDIRDQREYLGVLNPLVFIDRPTLLLTRLPEVESIYANLKFLYVSAEVRMEDNGSKLFGTEEFRLDGTVVSNVVSICAETDLQLMIENLANGEKERTTAESDSKESPIAEFRDVKDVVDNLGWKSGKHGKRGVEEKEEGGERKVEELD